MRKEFLIHFIFQVYYSTNPQLPLSRWESQFVDNNKLTTISDLTPHTIYTIRVEAYTSIGPGPLSTPVQVYSTVQCTGLQYCTVYRYTVLYSVQVYSTVQCTGLQYCTLYRFTVLYSVQVYSTVHCTGLQYCTLYRYTVLYSVQVYSTVRCTI